MRDLAEHLGSGLTSVYWYFRSKDELLQVLTNRVSRRLYQELPPIGTGPWHEELFAFFMGFHRLVDGTPLFREVLAYRARLLFEQTELRDSMLSRLEAGLGFLGDGGLTVAEAADAINACTNYTSGFIALRHRGRQALEEKVTTIGQGFEEWPLLAGVGVQRATDVSMERFDQGLRLIIDGVRRRVELRVASASS